MTTTESATLRTTDPEMIAWLTTPDSGISGARFGGRRIAEPVDGGVRITRLDLLRELDPDDDGSITDGPTGPVMWVDGNPHPLITA